MRWKRCLFPEVLLHRFYRDWPNVFGMIGTAPWAACERVYPVPTNAVMLQLSPCNLGASGTMEFRALSLTVCRARALVKADAPLLVNPKPSWHKLSWFAEFAASIPKYRDNTIATAKLAIAAREHLFGWAQA